MIIHRIEIATNSQDGAAALFRNGRLIFNSRNPLKDAAAWLLESSHAAPGDLLELWSSDTCLHASGRVGSPRAILSLPGFP